jgi:GDPmannose 4,6-dehydratase
MEKQKVAIVTGVCGQTGSYLAELLLNKGYKVIGTRRRTSNPNLENVAGIINNKDFEIYTADITDFTCVRNMILKYQPDEIYNLAAQSFVKESFSQPFHTFDANTVGVLNFLEVLKQEKLDCKMYQASTSEMFGKNISFNYDIQGQGARYDGPFPNKEDYCYKNRYGHKCTSPEYEGDGVFQDEDTPFVPQSPYGVAKLAAHHMCRLYRESYGVNVSCGILFNHESPRRGKEFVTRKITDYVGQLTLLNPQKFGLCKEPLAIYLNEQELKKHGKLKLGNLDAFRDWGHAKDYAASQWLILQQEKPDDYVVCTGETHTVREFCDAAFSVIELDYKDYVEVDPQFYRPAEVDYLRGDCYKAKQVLGWKPEYTFKKLVSEMVQADIERYKC